MVTSLDHHLEAFLRRIEDRSALIGVVGIGYGGLPVATVERL